MHTILRALCTSSHLHQFSLQAANCCDLWAKHDISEKQARDIHDFHDCMYIMYIALIFYLYDSLQNFNRLLMTL